MTSDDDHPIPSSRLKRLSHSTTISSNKHEDYIGDLRRDSTIVRRGERGEGGGRTGQAGDEVDEGWMDRLDCGRSGEMGDAGIRMVESTKEEEQRVLRKIDKVSRWVIIGSGGCVVAC
jgi:hypothetical protein